MKQLVLLSLVLWCAVCCYCQSSSEEELSLQSTTAIAPMATTSIHSSPTTPPPGDGGRNLSDGAIAAIVTSFGVLVACIIAPFTIAGVICGIKNRNKPPVTGPPVIVNIKVQESSKVELDGPAVLHSDHTDIPINQTPAPAAVETAVHSPFVSLEPAVHSSTGNTIESDQEPIRSDPGPQSDHTVVKTSSDRLKLLELLEEENANWHSLGIQLDVDTGVLKDIQRIPQVMTVENKFEKMLDLWLKKDNATWDVLKQALKKCGENALASSLPSQVEMPPIGELVRLLKGVMSKWKRLALFLEVNTDAIIPGDRQCCDCMTDMITEWMNRKKNKATIGAVVQALQHLGNNKLAREIEQAFRVDIT